MPVDICISKLRVSLPYVLYLPTVDIYLHTNVFWCTAQFRFWAIPDGCGMTVAAAACQLCRAMASLCCNASYLACVEELPLYVLGVDAPDPHGSVCPPICEGPPSVHRSYGGPYTPKQTMESRTTALIIRIQALGPVLVAFEPLANMRLQVWALLPPMRAPLPLYTMNVLPPSHSAPKTLHSHPPIRSI